MTVPLDSRLPRKRRNADYPEYTLRVRTIALATVTVARDYSRIEPLLSDKPDKPIEMEN